jgi:hypothetical protein
MHSNDEDRQDAELPPPGTRFGSGAQSVLPYLTKSLQAKPAETPEPGDQSPHESGRALASRPPAN